MWAFCAPTFRGLSPRGEPSTAARPRPARRVYPRVCGGAELAMDLGAGQGGLSPRVRGSPGYQYVQCQRPGSIPACAGEPCRSSRACGRRWVYPRVCGGALRCEWCEGEGEGLSPRVRGSLVQLPTGGLPEGSIPACAGEPGSPRGGSRPAGVYPRVCGGAEATKKRLADEAGLSPRVRGSREGNRSLRPGQGSIPACAGEPSGTGQPARRGGVYPRVCGGARTKPPQWRSTPGLSPRVRGEPHHGSAAAKMARVYPRVCGGAGGAHVWIKNIRGLSPRVRGSRVEPLRRWPRVGSIPACAGEPRCPSTWARSSRVYPRVCGGARQVRLRLPEVPGLSPRVRGSPRAPHFQRVPHRSIPACAGEPPRGRAGPPARRVYPRVCGGAVAMAVIGLPVPGLSPRVRGSHAYLAEHEVDPGSIPACAGEPKLTGESE